MNIFELLFFMAAIVLAVVGAQFGRQWGFAAGAGLALIGLFIPFLLGQLIVWLDERRFASTFAAKLRYRAEKDFENSTGIRPLKSWRARPARAKDGSLIVTIFFGNTKPPRRAFYRYPVDSEIPIQISEDEASRLVKVYPMK